MCLHHRHTITLYCQVGSVQEVAWASNGGHWGGYTYRLCQVPREGRAAITEECFTKNVLKFASNYTMIRALNNTDEAWVKFDQRDLKEGTYPKGSIWRPVGVTRGWRVEVPLLRRWKWQSETLLRKDSVVVPGSLQPGNYVLGWRWDGAKASQVRFFYFLLIFCPGLGFVCFFEACSCSNRKECRRE